MYCDHIVFSVCVLSLIVTISPYSHTHNTNLERAKYEEGKRQFEVIEVHSKTPRYGQCWKDAIMLIHKGCKELTDVIQSRLALAYLNCFLEIQKRPLYLCDWDEPIDECTVDMSDVDRTSFTTFFTHTNNICFFLESQIWHEETEKTINRLADSSAEVAGQLEESSHLQSEMIQRQNVTLQNQEIIINKAVNLSQIITSSSDNIHVMFNEFKESTNEQRLLINDVFDRVAKLQSMVIGEFSGFYSLVYYTLSVLICYLLTSTSRTCSARFWLFGLMTLNMIVERTFITGGTDSQKQLGMAAEADLEAEMYSYQWLVRKISGLLGLIVLIVCAYRYRDLNVVNNQLLITIQQQNARLEQSLIDGSFLDRSSSNIPKMIKSSSSAVVKACADSTLSKNYDSDSSDSGCSSHSSKSSWQTDHTYKPYDDSDESRAESYSTAVTKSSRRSVGLLDELRDLRSSSPFREMSQQIASWAHTGYYKHSTPERKHKNSEPRPSTSEQRSRSCTPEPAHAIELDSPRYFLRPRKSMERCPQQNPLLRSESPRTFSKKIQNLEEIAVRNSILTRQKISKRHRDIESSDL